MKDELTQRFELCMNGSLEFWISLGLLAGVGSVAAPFGESGTNLANYGAEPCKVTPSSHVFPV
jgi:hypothetical protein